MASNQTSNYGLNQWEATDQVLREEFNQDNQKIDAALSTNAAAISAEAAERAATATRFICGSYEGTGVSGAIHYSLGMKPKFLFLIPLVGTSSSYYVGLLAAETFCLPLHSDYGVTGSTTMVSFTDDGFSIIHSSNLLEKAFNRLGVTYRYLAIC